mgnify:FL=1|jgi:hypothetical protein
MNLIASRAFRGMSGGFRRVCSLLICLVFSFHTPELLLRCVQLFDRWFAACRILNQMHGPLSQRQRLGHEARSRPLAEQRGSTKPHVNPLLVCGSSRATCQAWHRQKAKLSSVVALRLLHMWSVHAAPGAPSHYFSVHKLDAFENSFLLNNASNRQCSPSYAQPGQAFCRPEPCCC